MKSEKLSNLQSYCHFRRVQNQDKQDMIDREEAVDAPDFLDDLSTESIKLSWSIQLDTTKTIVRKFKYNLLLVYN